MVKIALQIRANLECIEKLYTNHPHYQWFLKLKCSSCGEVSEKFHDLTEAEKVPQKHNRSESNLLIKCKLCSRENSMDVIEGSNVSSSRVCPSCRGIVFSVRVLSGTYDLPPSLSVQRISYDCEIISKLTLQGPVNNEVLKEMGLTLHTDSQGNSIKIAPLPKV